MTGSWEGSTVAIFRDPYRDCWVVELGDDEEGTYDTLAEAQEAVTLARREGR